MTVPKYHELIRPLLDLVADGRPRNLREASQELAERLQLSDEDLSETLPSGYPRYLNRVGWAKSDLNKTGLIESCGRGLFRISDKGRNQLPELPLQLDRKYFEARGMGSWKAATAPNATEAVDARADEALTPEERIDEMLTEIQASLFDKAKSFRDSNIHEPGDYEELKQIVENGWAYAWWCGDAACEAKVKEDTKATTRCIPLDQPGGSGKCVVCGKPASEKVYFSKAY